jgi:histidinol-phosphate/aromatic aminotransferase/cobyric acid decarboxylase-like protein/choline kinase
MHAVVLAAGCARRMHPLSAHCHKALLPMAGTTILGRLMTALVDRVDEVTIVTGHRADDIREFIERDFSSHKVNFVYNARYLETNNIVSLALAFDHIDLRTDLLLIECDVLFDPAVIEPLFTATGNIALVDHWRLGMDGTVVSANAGTITNVWPSHLQGADFDYEDKFKTLNIYRFERAFCQDIFRPLLSCYANLIDGNAFYELVLGMLINMQRYPIQAALVSSGAWAEVDDPNDLRSARFTFEPDQRAALLEGAYGGYWNYDLLDFSLIRNSHFPSPPMIAALRHALPELLRNYGSAQALLNEKLSWFLLCDPGRVQVLHGASQVIPMLPELLGIRRALVPAPTFGEWSAAFPDAQTYRDAPGIDTDALLAALPGRDAVVFVNPNNPTGSLLSPRWIHEVAAANPGIRVIVDESFADFAERPSVQALLEDHPLDNVVIVKSLGKSLGVPGLRLGYCYSCDPALIGRIGAELPVWNLSAPAEFFLELLLKHRPDLALSFERTLADRAVLHQRLAELPIVAEVVPSAANFLLVRLAGISAASLTARLLAEHGIYVKGLSGRFEEDEWVRVAVRVPPENERLVRALAAMGEA